MKSIYTYICIHIDIMKQRFIIIVSIIISLLFVMMAFQEILIVIGTSLIMKTHPIIMLG